MSKRGFGHVYVFAALVAAASLACGGLSTSPSAPTAAPAATAATVATPASSGSAATTTFTDQKNLFAVEVPSGWAHTQDVDKQNNYWYQDTFKSPDGHARIDSIVYNDGTPWTGSQNGAFALQLLNQYYSNTGKSGDIKVSGDSIQQDGSERLDWTSKSGGYSGESFFEVRQRMTFLMFTIMWDDSAADQYNQTLNAVVTSYKVP